MQSDVSERSLALLQIYVPAAGAVLPRESPPSLCGLGKLASIALGLAIEVDVLDMRTGFDASPWDVEPFFDDERVVSHLRRGDPEIDTTVARILADLGFTHAAWVGLSLSLACMVPRHVVEGRRPYLNVAACMARYLRQRWPSTIIAVGGLRAFTSSEDHASLKAVVDLSPIDHVVLYDGEGPLAGILRGEQPGPPAVEQRGRTWWWTQEAGGDTPFQTLPSYHPKAVSAGALRPSRIVSHYRMHSEWADEVLGHEDAPAPLLQFAFIHGCPGQCAFCSQAGTELRMIPVPEVVDALIDARDRLGCSDFTFVNSQINASKAYATAFCDELVARRANIRWSDSVNCRSLDEPLLDKMRQAGAIRLVFGVETPDSRMLRYVRKGTTLDRIERMLRHSDSLGIWNHVLLIGGVPYETDDSLTSTCTFLEGLGDALNHATVSAFYLPEGSPFQKTPEAFGIELLGRDQGRYAFRELNGLSWEAKRRQIEHSTRAIRASIARVTRTERASKDMLDLDLLHLLYRRFGPDRKRDIQRVYRMTFADDLGTVLVEDPTLLGKLKAFDLSLRVDGPRSSTDVVELTPWRGERPLPLSIRVGVLGHEPPRYRGRRAAYCLRQSTEQPLDVRVVRLVDAIGRALVSRADGFFHAREAQLQDLPCFHLRPP